MMSPLESFALSMYSGQLANSIVVPGSLAKIADGSWLVPPPPARAGVVAAARREQRAEAERGGSAPGGLEEPAARQLPPHTLLHDRIHPRSVVVTHSSSSSIERSSCGVTAKVCSGFHESTTRSPGAGTDSSAPRFWTYTVIAVPPGPSILY